MRVSSNYGEISICLNPILYPQEHDDSVGLSGTFIGQCR